MPESDILRRILARLNEITGRSDPVAEDRLPEQILQRLDQAEKIVSSIQRYLPKRVIDKILLNPDGVKVEGERRPVTVLFGDLSGFTAMSETMDPEQVVEVVNQYFDTMVEIAERYGGHIDKFMGDALMVLFGAPVVHEDDALRACLAAVEMLEAMDRFSAERQMDLAMSIGLNTGEVVALNVGSKSRMEYTVIGDGVNLAARLEKVATARQCVIGENTYRQVRGKIRLQKLKPVMVKGKSKPQNVYLILGRLESEERARGLRVGSIKLAGRMDELDLIRQAIGAAHNGQGRAVSVVGEAGIGKSRLAKELELLARDEGFAFAKGKCYSYSSNIAYLPFLRQLSILTGIADRDSNGKKQERLQEHLAALDLADYEPYLGSLLGLEYPEAATLDPEKRKRKTFEAIQAVIDRLAAKAPLALAFEDLQWADSLSLELLDHIVRAMPGKGLLLCLDYRPELSPGWAGLPHAATLKLTPLPLREAWQMVCSLAGTEDVEDRVMERIMERTEGNPLFIEEIVQHLLSRRLVKREGASLAGARRFGAIALPHSLSGVVLSRIDKLSEELRRVLQYAAVIGKEFDHETLAHLSRATADQVQGQLDTLEQSEGLLYSKTFEGRRSYEFHSTTTYEAAYSTLLKERRRDLHGKVAQVIERTFRDALDSHYPDLAHHYYHSKDQDKAVLYLERAGQRSRSLYANVEAIDFLQKAIDLLGHGKRTGETGQRMAEMLGAQGATFRLIGQNDRALKIFLSAVRIAEKSSDGAARRKFQLEAGIVHAMTGQPKKSLALMDRVLKDAAACGDRVAEGKAMNNRGSFFLRSGDLEQATQSLNRALEIYTALRDQKEIARINGSLGQAYLFMGDPARAIERFKTALFISDEIHYLEGQALYHNNLGTPLMMTGAVPAAAEHFQEALSLAQRIGDKRVETLAGGSLGNIEYMQGNYDRAFSRYTTAHDSAVEIGDIGQQMAMTINTGCIRQLWGDAAGALEDHLKALDMALAIHDKGNEVETRRNLGLDYLILARFGEAGKELDSAMEGATAIGDPRMQAYVKANRGGLLAQLGDTAAAAMLAMALDEARKVGDPEVILCAVRGQYELFLETGQTDKAREQAERALRISRDTGNRREQAYALLAVAALHLKNSEIVEMAEPLAEAMPLAQELKDKILLVRLSLLSSEKALALKSYREAEDYLKDAFQTLEGIECPELLWQCHHLRGRWYHEQELEGPAAEEFTKAREVIEKMREPLDVTGKKMFVEGTKRKALF